MFTVVTEMVIYFFLSPFVLGPTLDVDDTFSMYMYLVLSGCRDVDTIDYVILSVENCKFTLTECTNMFCISKPWHLKISIIYQASSLQSSSIYTFLFKGPKRRVMMDSPSNAADINPKVCMILILFKKIC